MGKAILATVESRVKDFAHKAGAVGVGIASSDRLTQHPSMDPTYLLPGARSIVSLMLPLDEEIIRQFLAKEDRDRLQAHETEVYQRLYKISEQVADYLQEEEGRVALAALPNLDYRYKETPAYRKTPYRLRQKYMDWMHRSSGRAVTKIKRMMIATLYERDTEYVDWNLTPSFSHRYGAVAVGLASLGWSGNAITPEFGSRVLFCTVITEAALESDPLLMKSPCTNCRICTRVCQVGMLDSKVEDAVEIGGQSFAHVKKGHNIRCSLCCAGFTGQDKHSGWSTWSPGRIKLPEGDENIVAFWDDFVKRNLPTTNYTSKVLGDLVFHTHYGFIDKPEHRFRTTCGNCQLVCAPTIQQRKKLHKTITTSGEVVEGPNHSLRVVKAERSG